MKKIIYILFLILSLLFISCNDTEIKVEKIELHNYEEIKEVNLNEYKLSDFLLKVEYSDGTFKIIKLENSMISDSDIVKFSKEGTHQVYVTYEGAYTSFEFTVKNEKENLSGINVVLSSDEYIYNGLPIEPTFSVLDGSKQLTANKDYTYEYLNNVNAGMGIIQINGIGDYSGTYNEIFTISKADLVVKADDILVQGDEIPKFTVSYEGFKYTDTEADLTGYLLFNCAYDSEVSGEYEITPSGLTSHNYNIVFEKGVLTIDHIKLKDSHVIVANGPFYYTGSEITPKVTVTIDDEVLDDSNYEVKYYNNISAGTGRVVITGKKSLYGTIERNFLINKVDLQITVDDIEINYLDKLPEYVVKYYGLVNGESVENLDGQLHINCDYNGKEVGTYPIRLSGYISDNYNITYKNGTLKVNKVAITDLILDYQEVTYNGREIKPSFSVYRNDNVLSQNIDYEITYDNNINVGNGSVTVKGINNFYGEITKSFVINKAALIITIDSHTIEYGETVPEFTYSIEGFVNGQNINDIGGLLSVSSNYKDSVGKYDITGSGLQSNNYKITYVKGLLTINQKAIKNENITISNDTLIYTGKEIKPQVEIKTNSGETLKENIDYTISYMNNVNAGTGTIIIVCAGNYTGTFIKEFTIGKKDLTVTSNSYELTYGDEVVNYEAEINGFVEGENISNLNGSLEFVCNYNKLSNVGSYEITLNGLTSNNYNISYQNGSLLVKPKDISKIEIEILKTEYLYTGLEIIPELVVKFNDSILVSDVDYKLNCENNINVGEGKVTITGINNYTGNIDKVFNINKNEIIINVLSKEVLYLEVLPELDKSLFIEIINDVSSISNELILNNISIECNYSKGMVPGEYLIKASGYANENINVIYNDGYIYCKSDVSFVGEGTEENPYVISSPSELYGLGELVNKNELQDKHYILGNNIDFEGYSMLTIGNKTNPFTGVFNGKGYSINNINIIETNNASVGLFGQVKDSVIVNLGVNGITINNNNSLNIGGLVGSAVNTNINNCYVNNLTITTDSNYDILVGGIVSNIDNGEVLNSYVSGTINTNSLSKISVGALCGEAKNMLISDSYTNVYINASGSNVTVSGIVGSIENSFVYNVYSLGNIKASGEMVDASETFIESKVSNSYYENVLYSNEIVIESNEVYTNNGISINEIIDTMKGIWDLDKWIFIDNNPVLYYQVIDDVKYVSKPEKIICVYGNTQIDYYGYTINTNGIDISNVGTYSVILELKPGFKWDDSTNVNLELQLEVVPKNLYIDIDSIVIEEGEDFNITYKYDGLLDKDLLLLDELDFIYDYDGSYGTYIIDLDNEFDNYNLIYNKGYLYVKSLDYNKWSIWDGTYQNGTFEGAGTEMDPFLIGSANDLATLAYKANNGENTDYYYTLVTNIDLNNINWPVIGNEYGINVFNGKFNGNGYVINNLYINNYNDSSKQYLGLFGHVKNAEICNLDILNGKIEYVGFTDPYLGLMASFVDNSYINSCEINGTIDCTYYGTFEVAVGGMFAYVKSNSTIENVISNAVIKVAIKNVKNTNARLNAGGIAGVIDESKLTYGYALGNIVIDSIKEFVYAGGICGYANDEVIGSLYSLVNITTNGDINLLKISSTIGYQNNEIYDIMYNDNVITINGVNDLLEIIYTGEYKSLEEIGLYINDNWDYMIWDLTDLLNPKLIL